jgi:hypothetical protein
VPTLIATDGGQTNELILPARFQAEGVLPVHRADRVPIEADVTGDGVGIAPGALDRIAQMQASAFAVNCLRCDIVIGPDLVEDESQQHGKNNSELQKNGISNLMPDLNRSFHLARRIFGRFPPVLA